MSVRVLTLNKDGHAHTPGTVVKAEKVQLPRWEEPHKR